MLRSFHIGKLFGIPLYVHSTFLLLPAWILLANFGSGLGNALFLVATIFALFGCVVLHELGHALMARHFGIGTQSITLYPIGGVARLLRMSEKPLEEICIALAGPAVNLVLAALLSPAALLTLFSSHTPTDALYGPQLGFSALGQFLTALWIGNIWLLLFNLIPCFPMDGGRVLRALLALGLGQLRATEIAARIGMFLAFLIAALSVIVPVMSQTAISPWPMILAGFVLLAGQWELAGVRQLAARRQAARLAVAAPQVELVSIPVQPHEAVQPRPRPETLFSGIAWDDRYRVWVQWHNGYPVAYWG
jgi:Zn-dependent protease